jgi:endonuclease/exonuclease/phosphatase family metal-dependent hydrolase
MIHATIDGRAIACTHLSSDLTTVPYPSGHAWSSWKDEQAAQIDKVTSTLPAQGCRIVLGDMNASQSSGSIEPELEGTLAGFSAKGFREPWASPVCTWCPPPANPLASGRSEKQYDHVLVAGCGTPKYRRILDQAITVQHDGKALETRLSDHFGLLAEIPR